MLKNFYKNVFPLPFRSKVYVWRHNFRRELGLYLIKPSMSFLADGFATQHFVGFRNDPKFNSAYASAMENLPKEVLDFFGPYPNIEWRAHICTWAANQALQLEGDFIECGVWYGVLSKTICEHADFKQNQRNFFLIDTWGDLPGSHKNYQADIFNQVEARFSMYPKVKLIRGLVPTVLDQVASEKIAYLSIDMNGSLPELAALNFFYPKMVKGGIIYFDDYGWPYPELRKVVDEFFSDKPETLLHFPSGNSIVVKV
jgi:O-methyltransferase